MNDFLMEKLEEKKWYNKSPDFVKSFLSNTSEKGIIVFLANINDNNVFGEIMSLKKIWIEENIFGLIFEVRSNLNNQVVEVPSINWKEGQNPLIRGIILIENDHKISHIAVEKKFNLVTQSKELRTFGIAYPDFLGGKLIKLPQKIFQAIPMHEVINFWDLGYVYADSNIISGKSGIFAVGIRVENLEKIDKTRVEIFSIDSINELVEISKDSYLLAIITKLKNIKIL